jgi:multisubunit Na+/H+ antiporter MnhE subunit
LTPGPFFLNPSSVTQKGVGVRRPFLRAVTVSAVEFIFLLGLWMLFVSRLRGLEVLVGVCAAFLGAVADAIVRAKSFIRFQPRAKWLSLFLWEPWYVLAGSVAILCALAKRLAGKKSDAEFRIVPFRAGGNDPESATRRALAVTLTSISPDLIVVGIEKDKNFMLVHEISPSPTPLIAKRLGATE